LADTWDLPHALIAHMRQTIRTTGSVVSWNKGYENTRNSDMATLYPQHAEFLNDITARTVDLQDIFKKGYVDIGFDGSTSIKNVLPVIAPELTYKGMAVGNGGEAMVAFGQLITLADGAEKDQLRQQLLVYCELDSYAMVRLFQFVLAL